LGASGATGRLVVMQLARNKIQCRIVVREKAILPLEISENNQIEIIKGNIDDFNSDHFKKLIHDCDSAVCCLGHNVTFKGIYGKPRELVSNAVKKITEAINLTGLNIKLILMSTTAFTNKKINEKNTLGEKIVFTLLDKLLPPHCDNMHAANYLINNVGENEKIEWVAVRPDSLINEDKESEYEIFESPVRSPIFNSGETSRINVSHFIVELLCNDKLWQEWKFKFPVIYNKGLQKIECIEQNSE
jgi:nucleoside-diphosphate-sugar epimerase